MYIYDLYLKGEQALGIVYTYCQKLSLLEQSFGPPEMLYCKQSYFVSVEKEVAVLKKPATTEQPLLCTLLPKQGKYPTTCTTKGLRRKVTKASPNLAQKGTDERKFLAWYF